MDENFFSNTNIGSFTRSHIPHSRFFCRLLPVSGHGVCTGKQNVDAEQVKHKYGDKQYSPFEKEGSRHRKFASRVLKVLGFFILGMVLSRLEPSLMGTW